MILTNYPVNEQISEIAEKEQEYAKNELVVRTLREKILILENALADKEKIIQLMERQLGGQ